MGSVKRFALEAVLERPIPYEMVPVPFSLPFSLATLSFEPSANSQGSTGTFNPGTVQFANGAGITVEELCVVQVKPKPTAAVTYDNVPDHQVGQINIGPGGTMDVYGVNTDAQNTATFPSKLPVVNGGTLKVRDRVIANFQGKVNAVGGLGRSIYQVGGVIEIQNGSTLKGQNGVFVDDGDLRTRVTPLQGVEQTAYIEGNLDFDGDNVVLGYGETAPQANRKLYVMGNVAWTAGQYSFVADGNDGTKSDVWYCTGNFTVGGTANMSMGLINNPTPPAGREWIVLEAGGSISKIGGYTGPNVAGFDLVEVGNPVKQWKLKKR